MAANNKRESIILAVVAKINELDSIVAVKRKMPEGIDELKTIASIQFPFVSVMAKLPSPEEHRNTRHRANPHRDKFISQLEIMINCYFMDNQNPDITMGNLADDLFAKLYEDQTLGRLAVGLEVVPQQDIGVWDPYGAFSLICRVTYIHGTGGI